MKAGDCVNVIFPRVLSSNNEVSVRFSPQEGDPQQDVSQVLAWDVKEIRQNSKSE